MASKKKVMRTIKFHYFSDRRISSMLIRARLSSKFQHVGIELDDGRYIDSTLSHGGVVYRDLPGDVHTTHTTKVSEENYNKVIEFLNAIEGTKYDVPALIGFFVTRKFHDSDEWFCSELAKEVFKLATGIDVEDHVLISPGGLRLITETYQKSQEKL